MRRVYLLRNDFYFVQFFIPLFRRVLDKKKRGALDGELFDPLVFFHLKNNADH